LLLTVPLKADLDFNQPAVLIKAINETKGVIAVHIQREPGMDYQSGYREGPWYLDPGKSGEGTFRGNKDSSGRIMYFRVLDKDLNRLRDFSIPCSKSDVGFFNSTQTWGTCTLSGSSGSDVVVEQSRTGKEPDKLLVTFHVKRNTK
jgi:hypothetical protein